MEFGGGCEKYKQESEKIVVGVKSRLNRSKLLKRWARVMEECVECNLLFILLGVSAV